MPNRTPLPVAASLASLAIAIFCAPLRADDPPTSRPRVNTAAAMAGVRSYRRGAWGIVAVEIANPTDREARVLVSSSIKGTPHDQYARRSWIPPHAVHRSWQHIYIPETLDDNARSVDVESTAYDQAGQTDVPLPDRSGKRRYDNRLMIANRPTVTAVIANPPRQSADPEETAAEEAVDACVFNRFSSRRTAQLDGTSLPPTATALDGMRHLVLYNDLIADDVAAMAAVRRWLQSGGRLWIMLDRVQQSTVERLLGDVVPYQTVDRVELSQVQLKTSDKERWEGDDKPREFEQPVPLVRVLASDVEVAHTVDGWPASFMQRCGRGRILYTTLGMRAWLRPAGDLRGRIDGPKPRFLPRDPLDRLTGELFGFQPPSQFRAESFEEYLTQQIGYEIVDRNLVLLVLGAFCGGLLLTALWLRRVKRLERMRWIGPGWAVAVAAVLTGMGSKSRQSVPETVVVAQLVQAASNSEEVTVTGRIAVYRQEGSRSTVGMDHGGLLQPDFVKRPGTTRRMLWTDLDRWSWDDLDVPAGVQQTEFRFATNIRRPLRASGRFGPDGLSGTLETGPFLEPADAVVTTSTGLAVGVRLDKDSRFLAGPDQSLAPGVFIATGLLSDEQRRRQDVYRGLWRMKHDVPLVDRPTVLVWTQPIDMGFRISGEQRRAGSALLSIPLRLLTTPPATRVRIPAAFLPYTRVLDPDGRMLSGSYNNSQREWVERSGPSRTWLRVQLPPEVRPLVLDRATVTLHFDGPSQKLDVAGVVDKKAVIVAHFEKPTGEVRIPITRSDVLKLDPQGGLVLGVFVGEDRQPNAAKRSPERAGPLWRIQYVFIDVEGKTTDAH
jgi:hypothetical protein